MRGVGNFGTGISTNAEALMFSFKSPMNFSSGHPSSSEIMNPVDEMGSKTSPGHGHSEEDGNNNGGYITSFPVITSWDDDNKMFSNVSDNQVAATPDLMLAYVDFFLGGDEKRSDLPPPLCQRFPILLKREAIFLLLYVEK
ncbi:Uncharacterized protein Adt_34093 [Abeliophyllum distichum]|uniref:Uncharacterized protein n=1 Tax=Abeliophyllum distichum TaxID=126358 RepID=A0ABD1QY42_9LAMI